MRSALGLDLDVAGLALEEGRVDQVGDHAGAVQGGAVHLVAVAVEAVEEVDQPGRRQRHLGAERPDRLEPRPGHQHPMGHIQLEHGDRHAALEDDAPRAGRHRC
ncbi:MAG: hypothetical protein R3D28_03565 [Geminicoccaceae bacterium]